MRTITVHPKLDDDELEHLSGRLLTDDSYDVLIQGESVRVLRPDGTQLAVFVHQALSRKTCDAAYVNLRKAAGKTNNRGLAGGVFDGDVGDTLDSAGMQGHRIIGKRSRTRATPVKSDGTLSKNSYAKEVESGIIGYFDRNPRYPYCRTTAYNLAHPQRFAAALPFIRAVDAVFKRHAPERYAAQRAMIDQTSDDFKIHGTVFTTITVNRNWQTAVHTDKGDYRPGFGVLAALTKGAFTGCYFVIPKYRVAFDMQTQDVLLADVHEWHGNTAFNVSGRFERISCVFYYREKMYECGSAVEELERVKAERDPLAGL